MITIGEALLVNSQRKIVTSWEAQWSLKLQMQPHKLWLLFEGESKYTLFTSDSSGEFAGLEREAK